MPALFGTVIPSQLPPQSANGGRIQHRIYAARPRRSGDDVQHLLGLKQRSGRTSTQFHCQIVGPFEQTADLVEQGNAVSAAPASICVNEHDSPFSTQAVNRAFRSTSWVDDDVFRAWVKEKACVV